MIPKPWPIPPVRTPPARNGGKFARFRCARPPRNRGIARDELTGSPQLQWATQTEVPSVARLFELNCCAIPLTAVGSGGIFAVLARAVVGLDLGTQEDVDVLLTGGPSGSAHPSDSCAVVFIEIAADLVSQPEIVSEIPGESIGFSSDGPLPHIPSLVRTAARVGQEMQWSRGKGVHTPVPGKRWFWRRHGVHKKAAKRGSSSEASVPSRIPGNSARSRGRSCWQAARPPSQWSRSHSNTVQSEPCDVGIPAASRKSSSPALHEARTVLGAGTGINKLARSHQKEMCLPPTSRSCRSTYKVGYSSGSPEAHAH